MPPQALLSYLMGNDDESLTETRDLALLARSRMPGTFGLTLDFRTIDSGAWRGLATQIDAYKQLRALRGAPFATALTEPVGVNGGGPGWDVVQQLNPATGVATVFAFRNPGSAEPGARAAVAPAARHHLSRPLARPRPARTGGGRRSHAERLRHRRVGAVGGAGDRVRTAVAPRRPARPGATMRAVPAPIRPAPWSAADARAVTHLMLLVVALRVATALVAFFVNVTFPLDRPEQFTMLGATHYFWDPFTRYDSGWYYGIAARGYQWVEGGRNNLAFFPAYPWLMGVVGRLLGGTQADFYFAGIVVSWVSSVAAAGFVYATARLDLPPDRAWDAALLTFVFPFAFFFGVVYSEALFLLGSGGRDLRLAHPALVAGRRRRRAGDRHAGQRRDGAAGVHVAGVASRRRRPRRASAGACSPAWRPVPASSATAASTGR